MTTILDEAVNGWILTVFDDGKKQYVYETLLEAQEHRDRVEREYEYGRKKQCVSAT